MIKGLTFWGLVGHISSVITISSEIRNIINKYETEKDEKAINNIDTELLQMLSSKIKDEYVYEKVDKLIADNSNQYKKNALTTLFSDESIENAKNELYCKDPGLRVWDKMIDEVLKEYFRRLEGALNKILSIDTKYLSAKMDYQLREILGAIKQNEIKDVSKNLPYLKTIVQTTKQIIAVINKNLDIEIGRQELDEDYLMADDIGNAVYNLKTVLNVYDKTKIELELKNEYSSSLEAMHYYVMSKAQDTTLDLNAYYYANIPIVMDYINGFKEKNGDYYWAVGQMNLKKDDEISPFIYVMAMVDKYLKLMFDALQNKYKDKKSKDIEAVVVQEMYKYMRYQTLLPDLDPPVEKTKSIANCSEDTPFSNLGDLFKESEERQREYEKEKILRKNLIKQIYDAKEITDVQLATDNGMTLDELRKTLYWSTRNILSFKYVDVDITALSISGPYLGMLEDYFRKSEE